VSAPDNSQCIPLLTRVQTTSDPECSRLLKMTPTISSAGRSASRDLVSNSKSHDWPARRGFVRLAPAGIGKNFRGAGAMCPGTPGSQPTSRTTDLQADAVAGCEQDPPTRPAGTKAERRVPGARFERWERSHRARSLCGSHDPPHHPKEGRPHNPRKRYDAIVLGSGQVSYLLLIMGLTCFGCLNGLYSPPSLGGCGGWGGLGGTGGCGLGGGCPGWGGRAGWTSPVLVVLLGVAGFAGIGSHLDPRAALTGLVSARVIWRSLIVRLTPNWLVDILNSELL